jgi:hypothetical protein
LVPALLFFAAVFGFLFLTRLGGTYRAILARRWPAVLLAGAAIFALTRGAIWPAALLLAMSIFLWTAWPQLASLLRPSPPLSPHDTPEDSAARALLGVGPHAGADEIRRAYREKMARSHPDRGGAHDEAARLTAARDRLLKKKRR